MHLKQNLGRKPTINSTLDAWLAYLERPETARIELGLSRVRKVAQLLHLKPTCPVIIVGGTNGKGSTVAMLEACYHNTHYRVGAYTSPHLLHFNERIRVNQNRVETSRLCEAFSEIETARGKISLTYFEHVTLSALWIFTRTSLDVMILEVGLGGRLDATNIIDADLAILTSIDLDHMHYLGTTREAIAREKAGILRPYQKAVCGDPDPPASLREIATGLSVDLDYSGKDFNMVHKENAFLFQNKTLSLTCKPPKLAVQNVATVLQAVFKLQEKLPIDIEKIPDLLSKTTLTGRQEMRTMGRYDLLLDVAHNPHGLRYLAQTIAARKHVQSVPKVHAVFSMLADKDIVSSIACLEPVIDVWHVGMIKHPRASKLEILKACFKHAAVKEYHFYDCIPAAFWAAQEAVRPGDLLVVCGSFFVVSEVYPYLS